MELSDVLASLTTVGKRYGNGIAALQGVTLDIYKGEFLSLLGPSGCGKTTLLRLIAGLSKPTRGSIVFPGEARGRHETGFVFQKPTLLPWASVFDNVYLPFRLRGISRADAAAKISAALEQLGLGPFAKARPRELSLGMEMRVSLARALVNEPQILLMDEPFAALDEITRHRLNDDLLDLWRISGITIIFVTHSIFESAYLSSRIAVMTPQPGHIASTIECGDAARNDAYRLSADYMALCGKVTGALQQASAVEVYA